MWRFLVLAFCILHLPLHGETLDLRQWVLVTMPEGVPADVSTADLQVRQDGKAANSTLPSIQQRPPFRIGLVFDESGSGRRSPVHGSFLHRVFAWAGDTLRSHRGDVFLVGFNDRIITSTEITTDTAQLRSALAQLRPIGGSAIRDAVIHSTQKFHALGPEPQPTGRVILLVSDGFDNASLEKERAAVESAQRFGVRVYAISFPNAEAVRGKGLLEHLGNSTGGQAFFPSDEQQLEVALSAIEKDLTNSLLLGIVPATDDGKAHKLKITLSSVTPRYMPVFYTPPSR